MQCQVLLLALAVPQQWIITTLRSRAVTGCNVLRCDAHVNLVLATDSYILVAIRRHRSQLHAMGEEKIVDAWRDRCALAMEMSKGYSAHTVNDE